MALQSNLQVLPACRACLETKHGIDMLLDGGTWSEMFQFCVGLEVVENAGLCLNCVQKVHNYSEFKKMCHNSESFWKSLSSNELFQEKDKDFLKFELELRNQPNVDILPDSLSYDFNNEEIEEKFDHNEEPPSSETPRLYKESKCILARHRKKIKKRPYHCDNCKISYKKKSSLLKHLKECADVNENKNIDKSNTEDIVKCGLCDVTTTETETLQKHIQDHILNNDLSCKLCDFVAVDIAHMLSHRSEHLYGQKFWKKCPTCDKSCASPLSLQFHYRKTHLNKDGGFCTVCGKTMKCYKWWKMHIKAHTHDRYICDHCGRNFWFKYNIIAHLRDISDVNKFTCEVCGRGFKRKFNLKIHFENCHIISEKVKCEHCNKIFKSESTLKVHLRKVGKERPFACEVCDKRYSSVAELKQHAFWHTGVRPHCCELCGLKYKAKAQLKVHMRKHSGFFPFKCNTCEQSFSTSVQLRRHQSVHTGIRRHKCPHCDRSYNEKKVFLAHCRTKHADLFVDKVD